MRPLWQRNAQKTQNQPECGVDETQDGECGNHGPVPRPERIEGLGWPVNEPHAPAHVTHGLYLMAELSRDEFLEHMGLLREDVKAVHSRLDVLNGRTRAVEIDVAVLQDRGEEYRKSGRNWGLTAGGIGSAIGAALTYLFRGAQ